MPFLVNYVKRGIKILVFANVDIINEFSTLKLIQVQVLKFQTLFIEEISILAHFALFGDYDVKGEGYFTISAMYIKNLIIYSDLVVIFLFGYKMFERLVKNYIGNLNRFLKVEQV